MSGDAELLGFMEECLDILSEYARHGREAFLGEQMIQDAVVRRMEVLADAASRLSETLKDRHSEIPWRAISGFRNVVAHGCMGVDLEQVWDYLTTDMPALRRLVQVERG